VDDETAPIKVKVTEVELRAKENFAIAVGVDEDGEQLRFVVGLAVGRGVLEALQSGQDSVVIEAAPVRASCAGRRALRAEIIEVLAHGLLDTVMRFRGAGDGQIERLAAYQQEGPQANVEELLGWSVSARHRGPDRRTDGTGWLALRARSHNQGRISVKVGAPTGAT